MWHKVYAEPPKRIHILHLFKTGQELFLYFASHQDIWKQQSVNSTLSKYCCHTRRVFLVLLFIVEIQYAMILVSTLISMHHVRRRWCGRYMHFSVSFYNRLPTFIFCKNNDCQEYSLNYSRRPDFLQKDGKLLSAAWCIEWKIQNDTFFSADVPRFSQSHAYNKHKMWRVQFMWENTSCWKREKLDFTQLWKIANTKGAPLKRFMEY